MFGLKYLRILMWNINHNICKWPVSFCRLSNLVIIFQVPPVSKQTSVMLHWGGGVC